MAGRCFFCCLGLELEMRHSPRCKAILFDFGGTLDSDGLGGFIFNPIGNPQLTDANGCTIFANLPAGTYAVQEGTRTQTNWFQSAPKDRA